jgi:phage-related protein
MKPVVFLGQSLDAIRSFPDAARREAGHQLDRVQHGLDPTDWKPMTSIGRRVREIRIHVAGQFRVIYLASLPDRVAVLHAFRKKSGKTRKLDLDLARRTFKELQRRNNS